MRLIKLLVIAIFFQACQSTSSSMKSPKDQILPAVLSGLRLGMSFEDLVKKRPRAKPWSIGVVRDVELSRPDEFLVETLGSSSYFTSAGYVIKNHRLAKIALDGRVDVETAPVIRKRVVNDALDLWGGDFLRRAYTSPQQRNRIFLVFEWHLDTLRMMAAFPTKHLSRKKRDISLIILDTALFNDEFSQADIDNAELNSLFAREGLDRQSLGR